MKRGSILFVLFVCLTGLLNACGGGGGSDAPPPATSSDPLANWHLRNPLPQGNFFGVTYGNGILVAMGDVGSILSSPDGVTWTSRNSGTFFSLYGVSYGNGTFVAVTYARYSDAILTSPDGVTWTSRNPGTSSSLYGVTYGMALLSPWDLRALSSPPLMA